MLHDRFVADGFEALAGGDAMVLRHGRVSLRLRREPARWCIEVGSGAWRSREEVDAAPTGDAGRRTYRKLERLARHRARVRWPCGHRSGRQMT